MMVCPHDGTECGSHGYCPDCSLREDCSELLGTAGGAAFGLRQPEGVRYEVFNFDADARPNVLFTVRWRWLARLLVLTYEMPGSPCVAYWREKTC